MLYLLENIRASLYEPTLNKLKLIEVDGIYRRWKQELKKHPTPLRTPSFIDMDENVQQSVRERLALAQKWLMTQSNPIIPLDFLHALEPVLAFSYESLLGKIKTPEDFYAIDPKAYVRDPRTGKMYSSATFQNIQKQTVTPRSLQSSLNLTPAYFEAIDFGAMKKGDEIDEDKQKFIFALLLETAQNSQEKFKKLNLWGYLPLTPLELSKLLSMTSLLETLQLEITPQFTLEHLFNFSYPYIVTTF